MGRVILVRHGQASLGSADYDRLSARGIEQGEKLGEHWQREGLRFGAVFRGTLRRHRETLDAIGRHLHDLPAPVREHAGLNEYDGDALIRALRPGPIAPPQSADEIKAHFRLLREALLRWIDASITPQGMPSFEAFRGGVADVLARTREAAADGDVLVVSSGGPISVAAALVLDAPNASAVAMNMRLANSAFVELVSTARGLELAAFNALPHLVASPHLSTRA